VIPFINTTIVIQFARIILIEATDFGSSRW